MIFKDDDWVSLCEIKDSELCFTERYLNIMKPLCGGARRFASLLITGWGEGQEHEGLLDYFGSSDLEKDIYTGIDGDPMDVREDIPELWEIENKAKVSGLNTEWYRDILRSKLVTIKIPKRTLEEYVSRSLQQNNK